MDKLDEKVQKNRVTRLLTSHTALAFCYGIFLLLYEVKFLRETVPVVHPFLIAWAGALAVYDVVVRKLWQKLPLWQLLAGFALSVGVTALVNREAGLAANLKVWILTCLPLTAFLPLCLLEQKQRREKALLVALSGGAVVVLLASLVALVMYMLRMGVQLELFGITHMVGFRYYIADDPASGVLLYGFYTDTNHAAAYAVVFAFYSLWLLDACRRGLFGRTVKVLAIVNLVVQACYFPLANSRGGWLCLGVAVAICAFLYAFCTRLQVVGRLKRTALSIGCAVLTVVVLFAGLILLRSGLSLVSRAVNYTPPATSQGQQTEEQEQVSWGEQGADTFEKTDDGFGAGRLLIWKECLELFTKNPVLGIGTGNSAYYAQRYDLGYRLREGDAMHNSFLDLLVDCGAVGFALLMGFFVVVAVWVLRKMGTEGMEKTAYLAAFCVVFLLGISAFLSCAFINTTAVYYLMLLFTGYLLAQQQKERP